MATTANKIEFDLTIKKYSPKGREYSPSYSDYHVKKPIQLEISEELSFKALDAVEVIRKLLDYIYG